MSCVSHNPVLLCNKHQSLPVSPTTSATWLELVMVCEQIGKHRAFTTKFFFSFFLLESFYCFFHVIQNMELCVDFPGGSDGKSICLQWGRPGLHPWVRKVPWRRKWHPTPVLLPGKSHGRRSLVAYSPWGCKELDMTERLHFHFQDSVLFL